MTGTRVPSAADRDVRRTLVLSGLAALCGELQQWRTGPEAADVQPSGGAHLVFPFAKGLRLSARLIYVLRKRLSAFTCCVNWGQLLADGQPCSPECDIIIHRQGHVERWNGTETPVMDFYFVDAIDALAVVSCKSLFSKLTEDDRKYVRKMKGYVEDVFLFVECCEPGAAARLAKAAEKAGYRSFGYLYTRESTSGECVNSPKVWEGFLASVASKVQERMRLALPDERPVRDA